MQPSISSLGMNNVTNKLYLSTFLQGETNMYLKYLCPIIHAKLQFHHVGIVHIKNRLFMFIQFAHLNLQSRQTYLCKLTRDVNHLSCTCIIGGPILKKCFQNCPPDP